ncbi:MAG: hypothetical protein AAF773_19325 [Cyanobacteria bacterium P01_D01_bin.115]
MAGSDWSQQEPHQAENSVKNIFVKLSHNKIFLGFQTRLWLVFDLRSRLLERAELMDAIEFTYRPCPSIISAAAYTFYESFALAWSGEMVRLS